MHFSDYTYIHNEVRWFLSIWFRINFRLSPYSNRIMAQFQCPAHRWHCLLSLYADYRLVLRIDRLLCRVDMTASADFNVDPSIWSGFQSFSKWFRLLCHHKQYPIVDGYGHHRTAIKIFLYGAILPYSVNTIHSENCFKFLRFALVRSECICFVQSSKSYHCLAKNASMLQLSHWAPANHIPRLQCLLLTKNTKMNQQPIIEWLNVKLLPQRLRNCREHKNERMWYRNRTLIQLPNNSLAYTIWRFDYYYDRLARTKMMKQLEDGWWHTFNVTKIIILNFNSVSWTLHTHAIAGIIKRVCIDMPIHSKVHE